MHLRIKLILVATLPVLAVALVLLARGSVPLSAVGDVLVIGLLAGIALAFYMMSSLLGPLLRLRGAARHMAIADRGALPASGQGVDDLGRLASEFSAVASDVRHALQEARERDQEIEAIFLRMADGILVVDGELRIRRMNPAAAEILAIAPERAVGRTVIEATMNHALDELLRAALAGGSMQMRRLEVLQPWRRMLQVLVTPLDGTDLGSGAVAVLQDLTELDRVERVRRDFVTNVSHELRTPVAGIKVMVESLQRGAMEQPALRQQFLQSIGEAADRLTRLVDDVMALARVEAGPVRLEWHSVRLDELAREVAAAQGPLALEYGIMLKMGDLPEIAVHGDAEGLRQAVANLLTNAIKYNEPGGEVLVELRIAPGRASLVVSDTGIGIPAEHLPRVFERFYRVDRGRSRELGGTGLGLAIVKHVAEAHGGQVTVESAPGKGSVFTLALPTGGEPGASIPPS